MPSWQSLTRPIVCPEISGLLPEEDRGHWIPDKTIRARGHRVDYAMRPLPMVELVCHSCSQKIQVPARALSALCPLCRTHLQLGDYILKTGTRRSKVHTLGNVMIAANACLSRLNIICQDLTMKGTGDGSIQCKGRLCIYSKPVITQAVQANTLELRRGSHLKLEQDMHVQDAEIYGQLTGFIHASGRVHVHRGAILHGDCRALVLTIDPGGQHLGHFEQL